MATTASSTLQQPIDTVIYGDRIGVMCRMQAGLAASELGGRFIGIELDVGHHATASHRVVGADAGNMAASRP